MLSIGRLSAGDVTYYLDLAREDYYLNGGEPPGRWWGKGAEALGLAGDVDREELGKLFAGFSPRGEALVQNAGRASRCPAFDLTFSAPKSLSVVWSQADAETRRAVQEAHFEAVKAALAYLQDDASSVRRGAGGKERALAGLIVATFEHGTSRALDPQLHTHCVVLNVGLTADGRSGALQGHAVYQHKMAAGALYRAELIARTQHLGLEWEPYRGWFEIKGVPRSLISELSKRRGEIERYLAERGMSGAAASAAATLATRRAKRLTTPRSGLFQAWREVGQRHHFDPGCVLHRGRSQKARPAQAARQAIDRLTESRDHFSGPDVIQETVRGAGSEMGGAQHVREAVQEELNRSERVVRVGTWGGLVRYTTWGLIDSLNQAVDAIVALVRRSHGVSGRLVEKRIKALSHPRSPVIEEWRHHLQQLARAARGRRTLRIKPEEFARGAPVTLDAKYAEMVRHLTRKAKGSVRCVESEGGCQHLLMLRAVREAYESAGYRVIGAAPSRAAVEDLKKGAGFVEAKTLRGLEAWMRPTLKYRLKHHAKQMVRAATGEGTRRLPQFRLDRKTVVIVDDAAWLGTRQFEKLAAAAKRDGGLLVLTGFPRATKLDRPTPFEVLTRALRSRLPLRAVPEIKQPPLTIDELAKRGQLTVAPFDGAARERLIADWVREEAKRIHRAPVVCASDELAAIINRRLQGVCRKLKWLDETDRLKLGDGYVRAGDPVVFTKRSAALGVRRGEVGRVIAVKHAPRLCVVRLHGGETVVVPIREYTDLKLAYALTPSAAGEITAECVFVLGLPATKAVHLSAETRVYVDRSEVSPELRATAERAQRRQHARTQRANRPEPEPEMAQQR